MGSAASIQVESEWDPTVFPKLGVKLSFIEEFYVACGGRERLVGLTTTDVCEQHVKATITKSSQTSVCQLLQLQGHPAVGTATVFISHAWKYQFLDVISALQSHLKDDPDTIIWFDLFSNNQHKATSLDYEWWSTTFKSAIAQFGHTIMVLSPWEDPIPYQRAWCIFEAYCTAETNSRFEIAMSDAERDRFLCDICDDTMGKINRMLATIQAERSECYKPEDREKIFRTIQSSVGFSRINSMVFEQYRQWVVSVTEAALAGCEPSALSKTPQLMTALAQLYIGQGRYAAALPLLQDSILARRKELGETHPETLRAKCNLAHLFTVQGQYSSAQSFLEECLAQSRVEPGATHPSTLKHMCNLAVVYERQGNYSQAQTLLEEALSSMRVELGTSHHDTLLAMHCLADTYLSQGDCERAVALYEECLDQRRVVLGVSHPETLGTVNNIALAYARQGNYPKAHAIFEDCIARLKVVLGLQHPDTLGIMGNLARLHKHQGNHSQAQELYEECLKQRTVTLGEAHPDVLDTMHEIAILCTVQGNHAQALPLREACLAQYRAMHGPAHAVTQTAIIRLADIHRALGNVSQAQALDDELQAIYAATAAAAAP